MTVVRHILAVDDDPAIRTLIADYLAEHDFRVSQAADSGEMHRILAASRVDLIILDLKLAGEDGLQLARDLRTRSEVPIIILTGQRREEIDRILGLEMGADDYLTKPFSLRELLARIKAILRRIKGTDAAATPGKKPTAYHFADWELQLRTRRLTSPTGEVVPLTNGEFNLLLLFLRSPGQILSRDQLLNGMHLHDHDAYDRSIDVQILRLRRKLEPNPSEPQLIKTERGVGYVFMAAVEIA
ncbi:MAG: response regulator [Candidatus Contendobacter sp.]